MIYYTTEELLEIFEKHAKEAKKLEKERREKYGIKESECFRLSDALHSICKNINILENK